MSYFDDYLRNEMDGGKCEQLAAIRYEIPAAKVVAADADGILNAEAFPTAAGYVGTFLAQPPYPMTLTLVCSGTQTGNVVIHGTDIAGDVIEETIKLTSASAVETVNAFASVEWIKLPAKVAAETVNVGWGSKFGLPYKLANAAQALVKLFNGAADAGTLTASGADLAKNVFAPAGTPNGKKALEFILLV